MSDKPPRPPMPKAAPKPMPETALFWEKAAEGELWLPRCVDTGKAIFPPRAFSPFTGGDVRWERMSGRATLASFLIVHQAAPGFADEVPYVVALAQLEEGPHMITNLPGTPAEPAAVPIGAPLEVTFETRDGVTLPQFRVIGA